MNNLYTNKHFRKFRTYLSIKKHLKNLVKDLPKDIQSIVLEYNSIYSTKAHLEDIVEDASVNLYYEISKKVSPRFSVEYGKLLQRLNEIEL